MILQNIAQKKNIKLIYQNQMLVVKVEEYLLQKILPKILNRKKKTNYSQRRFLLHFPELIISSYKSTLIEYVILFSS